MSVCVAMLFGHPPIMIKAGYLALCGERPLTLCVLTSHVAVRDCLHPYMVTFVPLSVVVVVVAIVIFYCIHQWHTFIPLCC